MDVSIIQTMLEQIRKPRTELGLGWSAELGLRLPAAVRALARPGASPLLLKRRPVLLAIFKKKRRCMHGQLEGGVEEKQSLTGNNFVNFVEPRRAEKNE